MAKTPSDLQAFLQDYVGSDVKVYFQPPASVRMKYPCVKYSYNRRDNLSADNVKYLRQNSYILTVIDYDPESELSEKISELPMCSWDRFFTADNLNHFVYTLYY